MNDFCKFCCGGDKQQVKECGDKFCPFYRDRRANLDYQENKQWKQSVKQLY